MRGGSQEESRQGTRERGIDLIDGMAQFVSAEIVRADEREFTADHILIATGTEPAVPEIPGLQQLGYQTNRTIFEMPFVPERLAILGGGPVGVEFAQLFRRLGAQVTLIEMTPHILPKDDAELAAELQKVLETEGIEIKTQAKVSAVGPDPNGKRLTIQYENAYEETLLVDDILLAAGRKPVIEPLNLDQAAIDTEDGQIKVDDHLRTNVNHIWAAGDVANDFPFTHTAWRQGAYIAQQILCETDAPLDLGPVPWVTYTDPELANVGKTESEEGIEYRVASYKVGDVARAVITGDTEGRVKLLIGNDDRILGGHILATNAGDLIGSVITAMHGNLPASILAEAVWPYPTFSEAVGNAAASAFEKTLA